MQNSLIELKTLNPLDPSRIIANGNILRLLNQTSNDCKVVIDYQPKYALTKKKLVGFEALVRWRLEGFGLLQPKIFIPLFEKRPQLMQSLTRLIIKKVVKDIQQNLKGAIEYPIAVNISANDLINPTFVDFICFTLNRHKVDARFFEIEITETNLIQDIRLAVKRIRELREKGILVSIDDFGTGYSSLAYLGLLPVSYLKLDRFFVQNINHRKIAIITRNIISLARKLGLKIVAEGIENKEALHILQKMNCPLGQGFLLGKPKPRETIKKPFYY